MAERRPAARDTLKKNRQTLLRTAFFHPVVEDCVPGSPPVRELDAAAIFQITTIEEKHVD